MRNDSVFFYCPLFSEKRWHQIVYWVISSLLIVAFSYFVYSYVLMFWWAHDDAAILQVTHKYSPWDYLFSPEVYQKISKVYFTPLQNLPWNINYFLFGQDYYYYFVSQLVILCLLAMSTFIFLRLWITTLWSFVGALLLILSAPTAVVVSQLMNIHYLMGLTFSVISSLFFIIAIQKNNFIIAILGALFYLAASLSKELFVPLVGMLFFLPQGELKCRTKLLIPYVAAALMYLLLRYFYLPQFIYVQNSALSVEQISSLPWRILTYVFGQNDIGLVASAIVLSMIIYFFISDRSLRLFILAVFGGLMLPVLAVAGTYSADRFHILFAWVVIASSMVAYCQFKQRGKFYEVLSIFTLVFLSLAIFNAHSSVVDRLKMENQKFSVVGKFLMQNDDENALYLPGNYLRANDVKKVKSMWDLGSSPKVFYDYYSVKKSDSSMGNTYFYSQATNEIINDSSIFKQELSHWESSVKNKSLDVRLYKKGKNLHWNFGPYQSRGYSVVILNSNFVFSSLAHVGQYNGHISPMQFVVKFQSPQGWVTYSDPLNWKNIDGEELLWSRQ